MILEREELGFRGKVKSSLEYEFESKYLTKTLLNSQERKYRNKYIQDVEGIRDVPVRVSNNYLFDKHGRLIKNIRFIKDNHIDMEHIDNYIFDNNGKLIESNSSDFNEKLNQQKLFSYNEKGNLIQIKEIHFSDSFLSNIDITYLPDTIQINEVTTKRGDTTNISRVRYNKFAERIDDEPNTDKEFDSRGNLIMISYKRYDYSAPSFSTVYDYNSKNIKVKETEYDSLNNIKEVTLFYYNERDELIQEIHIDPDGTAFRQYDKTGYNYNFLLTPFDEEEGAFYGIWNNHDQYGNERKRIKFQKNNEGRIIEQELNIKMEYDDQGNWISKMMYQNDSLTTIIERKIDYFE